MDSRKFFSMLSLCQRAGKLISGEESCLSAIKDNSAVFVIIAADASDNTKKKFTDKCRYYNVDCIITQNKENLSRSIGKYDRAVLTVIDENFAYKIKEILNNSIKE